MFENFRYFSKIRLKRDFCENLDFGPNFFEKFKFFRSFIKILILVKFSMKNFIFGRNFKKLWFWSKFSIFSKISKSFNFSESFVKISITVQIFEKYHFFLENFEKFCFSQIFEKKKKFSPNFQKIWILFSIILKNIDFDLSQIFVKYRFWSKFSTNFDFFENSESITILLKCWKEFRSWSKFSKKIWIFSKISKNFNVKEARYKIIQNDRFSWKKITYEHIAMMILN